jgi:hypothetical protein
MGDSMTNQVSSRHCGRGITEEEHPETKGDIRKLIERSLDDSESIE